MLSGLFSWCAGELRQVCEAGRVGARGAFNQQSAFRFGQYVYVTGGDGHTDVTTLIHSDPGLEHAQLTVHAAEAGRYLGLTKTPWRQLIGLQSSSVNTTAIS